MNVYEGEDYFGEGLHIYWDDELVAVNKKTVFSGLCIRKAVNPRWTLDEPEVETPHFEARLFTDDTILIGYPAMDYDHFHNLEKFPKTFVSSAVKKKMDESRNKFAKLSKEQKRRWCAVKVHPRSNVQEVLLSVKEIYRNEDFSNDTSLELKYFPVASKHEHIPLKTINWFAQWHVVVKDGSDNREDRKRGKPDVQSKLSSAARLMAGQMDIYKVDDESMPDSIGS